MEGDKILTYYEHYDEIKIGIECDNKKEVGNNVTVRSGETERKRRSETDMETAKELTG